MKKQAWSAMWIGASVLVAGWAGAARAELGATCASDTDCGKGLVCEVVGGTACACPAGGECPPCETSETRACVPGPCATNGDCADGYVCVSYEVPCATNMSEPACDPDGASCPPPREPVPCTNEKESVCAPKWTQPCTTAADCGAGFTCEAEEICQCSGSAGTGSATPPAPSEPSPGGSSGGADGSASDREGGSDGSDGGSGGSGDAMPPDASCTCEPSEAKYCHPEAVSCTGDGQCPEGWTCEMGGTATTCARDSSGAEPACEPAPAPNEGECYPAGFESVGGLYEATKDATEAAAQGNDTGSAPPANPTGAIPGTSAGGAGCEGGAAEAWLALAALGLVARRRGASRGRA